VEEIFENHLFSKCLNIQIFKELLQLSNKTTNNLSKGQALVAYAFNLSYLRG
jgi:hypothetical protein